MAAGLILTRNALSMPVLIGILMLMGVVSKNAILLVDGGIGSRETPPAVLEVIAAVGERSAPGLAERRHAVLIVTVLDTIILCNTVYMERAIDALRAGGERVPDEMLSHLAPSDGNTST